MQVQKQIGRDDMLLSKGGVSDAKWVQTRLVDHADKNVRAVFLVECEVSDPQRFGYLNGTWWKMENARFEEPEARSFSDALGSYSLAECANDDPDKLFYKHGSYWKREAR